MGKRICATCDWYSRETMSCKNENSIICATGEGAIGMSPCADLCEECEEEFWKWLKEEETKAAHITP